MADFCPPRDPYPPRTNIRALDCDSKPAGASNRPKKYVWYWQTGVKEPQKLPLTYAAIPPDYEQSSPMCIANQAKSSTAVTPS
jgi:hypothetical protein